MGEATSNGTAGQRGRDQATWQAPTVMGWLGHYGLPLAAGILTSTVPAGFFMILAGVFPVGIMA